MKSGILIENMGTDAQAVTGPWPIREAWDHWVAARHAQPESTWDVRLAPALMLCLEVSA